MTATGRAPILAGCRQPRDAVQSQIGWHGYDPSSSLKVIGAGEGESAISVERFEELLSAEGS
ncbi:MAG: hypothetical protein MJD61_16580, partial [Proteobacteria bacterium]|nr:hypothetical protein [Pseudomonadota bacterium]